MNGDVLAGQATESDKKCEQKDIKFFDRSIVCAVDTCIEYFRVHYTLHYLQICSMACGGRVVGTCST